MATEATITKTRTFETRALTVARKTKTQVVLMDGGNERRFLLASGYEVGSRRGFGHDYWFLSETERARLAGGNS